MTIASSRTKNLIHIFALILLISTLTAAQESGIALGNMHISPSDMATALTASIQAAAALAEKKQASIEQKINQLEQQKKIAAANYDAKKLGNAEYEQTIKSLEAQIDRFNNELKERQKRDTTLDSNLQNIALKGWDAFLDNQRQQGERKTQVAIAGVTASIANEGRLQQLQFLTDPETLKRFAIYTPLIAGCSIASYYAIKLCYSYLNTLIYDKPTLALEWSRKSFFSSLFSFEKDSDDTSPFDDVIFSPEIETSLRDLALATKTSAEHGLPFRNLLLYGPPGTGKTKYARILARFSGLDYTIIPGSNFTQFDPAGEGVNQLNKLFAATKSGSRGMIIFIDEADALNRPDLLSAFLAQTGSAEDAQKIMLILATNNPQDLAKPILDRIDKQMAIPLPSQNERLRMLALYHDKYLNSDPQLTIDPDITPNFMQSLAQKTEGLSGRQLEKLFIEIKHNAYRSQGKSVSYGLIDRIADEKIQQNRQEKANFNKN